MEFIKFEEPIEIEELEQEAPEIVFPAEPIDCTTWAIPHFGTIRVSQQLLICSNAIWQCRYNHYEISDVSKELRSLIKLYFKNQYGVEYSDAKIDVYLANHGKMIFTPILLDE